MIKFSYTVPENEGCYTAMRSIEMSVDCEGNVYEIIEVFSDFLKGSGYAFDGRIELISKEETEAEDKVMLQAMAEHYFNLFEKEDKVSQKYQPEKGTGL
ncbi:hypothetical protein N9064_01540 [bacterium]|jgi:hypothetical protein|nr:hypothetical protein [Pseudomonadales bacterium]MDB4507556.1 hypothetical protein [bacterium]